MQLLALPFYTSRNSQDRFRRGCSGESVFAQYTDYDRFPPFQVKRDRTGELLDCVNVYRQDGTLFKTLLHPEFPYKLHQTRYHDYLTYFGAIIPSLNMPCGDYYLEVSGYYSELFRVHPSPESLLMLAWQNSRPLGGILYGEGFQQTLLLDTTLFQPEYKFDEEGENNGDEVFIRDRATLSKVRLLETGSIPEYLVDALNAVPLHDEIYIGTFEALGKVSAKTNWLKGDCRANVQINFEAQAPVLWTLCPDQEAVTEVNQEGFEPDPSVCGGGPDTRPRWNNTGQARCKVVEYWLSSPISEQVTRNNCNPSQNTQPVLYELPSGRFESLISQADADQKARQFFDETKQQYANQNGVCLSTKTVSLSNIDHTSKTVRARVNRSDTEGQLTVRVLASCNVYNSDTNQVEEVSRVGAFTVENGFASASISINMGGSIIQNINTVEITSANPPDYAF